MKSSHRLWLYVGTYNRREPHAPVAEGDGLITCSFDTETGVIERLTMFPGVTNSSYLAAAPDRGRLFCTSESLTLVNKVHSFEWKPDGSLRHLGAQPTQGYATCHLALLPGGNVCAASYMDSCISVFTERDSILQPAIRHFEYQGSGPNTARQETSHAHQVVVAIGSRWIYVVDLGADCIWRHDVGLALDPLPLPMPAGHGPRHMVFHPSLPRTYVLGEMTGAVTVCDFEETTGTLTIVTTTPVLGDDAAAAAIRIHPSAKALWISLRDSHSLQVFQLDETGLPTNVETIPLGDAEPRDFAISPDGRWLVSANQSANHLAVIELDPTTGLPTGTPAKRFDIGTPCSLLFMPTQVQTS